MNSVTRTLLHVALPLGVSAIIYLLFRDTGIYVSQWFAALSGEDFLAQIRATAGDLHPGRFIVYSLPGALWLYSFTSFLALVWRGRITPWLLVPICVAVASEGMQWLGLTDGTFDWADVAAYLGVTVIALALPLRASGTPDLAQGRHPRHAISFIGTSLFAAIVGAADIAMN